MDSRDLFVGQAAPRLTTGRKWTPSEATKQATAALKHKDIVGQVQKGKGVLGLGASTWHKAATFQRRRLVVEEIRQQEEATRCAKAVPQAKQGQWMT